LISSHSSRLLDVMNVAQYQKALDELNASREELLRDRVLCARRISELAPEHNKAPWMNPQHPEDQRSMEKLRLWRHHVESVLRFIEQDLRVAEENLNDAIEGRIRQGKRV
jgi:hypothetical protein